MAIFKHESQKDKALFPGPNDPREFWQRAEDRNRFTAEMYDLLGLPEYQAIEGFVRWKASESDQALVEAKAGARSSGKSGQGLSAAHGASANGVHHAAKGEGGKARAAKTVKGRGR
jgi:hypothetical protein